MHEPAASTMPGATEHIPVPEPQLAWTAVYHCLILVPVLSLTHSKYQLDCRSAFQVNVGVAVFMLPVGDIKVTLPGRTGMGAINVPGSLQSP